MKRAVIHFTDAVKLHLNKVPRQGLIRSQSLTIKFIAQCHRRVTKARIRVGRVEWILTWVDGCSESSLKIFLVIVMSRLWHQLYVFYSLWYHPPLWKFVGNCARSKLLSLLVDETFASVTLEKEQRIQLYSSSCTCSCLFYVMLDNI